MRMAAGPAYRIETPRASLRHLEPMHHALLSRAIEENLAHLKRHLPWAHTEPRTRAERVEWLRTQRGHFDLGGDYGFAIFEPDGGRVIGGAGLHLKSDVADRDIGYWIAQSHLRQGLATEVASALIRVGFELEGLSAINIRCTVDNLASAGVPQKLGFSGPELEPLSLPWPGEGKRDLHLYWLSRVDYDASPAKRLPISAYDVLGERLL